MPVVVAPIEGYVCQFGIYQGLLGGLGRWLVSMSREDSLSSLGMGNFGSEK
jgi:hypothetical protein